jgi:hypothetical protein
MKAIDLKKSLFLFLCCFSLLVNYSCKKTDDTPVPPVDQLPDPHTSDARSVFACLVNGEVWKPSFGINNPGYSYHEPTGGLSIGAENNSNNNWIYIGFTTRFTDLGTYDLKSPNYVNQNFCENYPQYTFDSLSLHQAEIEYFSKEEGIIIGTFEFTAINNDCPGKSDTVRITDGRFKATYK